MKQDSYKVINLSDSELAKAKAMFFGIDRDGSGSIDSSELRKLLESMGQHPSEEEVEALIRSVDGTGNCEKDGRIQLREFLLMYAQCKVPQASSNELEAFNVFVAYGGEAQVSNMCFFTNVTLPCLHSPSWHWHAMHEQRKASMLSIAKVISPFPFC